MMVALLTSRHIHYPEAAYTKGFEKSWFPGIFALDYGLASRKELGHRIVQEEDFPSSERV
jgi:hypothetical protein